ncbi:type II and III secretion system protein family protein [Oricola thermophila]|uniref:Type II and III secretion system protein family protein n=1 Tax=Oricola thermophila TaxID=2742145 RepID=A0A6N1VET5_9HYPH|nr:type II and III secretion system protein family protein [Oricola thermophila]QKV19470.1 type II and III secretion system protein family protein [Oricola thermophila]
MTIKQLKSAILSVAVGATLAAASPLIAPSAFGAVAEPGNIIKVGRSTEGSERVTLGLDKSIVLDLPVDAHDILVANPEVADAVTRTARRIYLFGKQVGETNIFIFDKSGRQVVSLDLRIERDVSGLDRYLARFIPDSDIKTEIINDNIVLTGTVQTPQDAAKASQIAEIFLKGGDATQNGFSWFFQTGNSQIVNMLDIVGGDQVTLKVTVAEVQRSVMKQLGLNLVGSHRPAGDGISFAAISEGIAGALGKPLAPSGLGLAASVSGLSLEAYFRAMEEAGVMRTLATPTLTAVSGETAVFKVGGDYNIIKGSTVDEDNGTTYSIETVEYGIGLEFTPVVLAPGRISLKIRTSVSEPTVEGTVPLSIGASNGASTNVLSIRRRLADTTVELPSGGAMMIAGLIRDDVRQVVSGFPGLQKLPVIGSLFRSRDYIRNESELVITVTPYLVRPTAPNKLALPTDNLAPPSDRTTYLLGRVNRIYGTAKKKLPDGRYHGAVGFIYK